MSRKILLTSPFEKLTSNLEGVDWSFKILKNPKTFWLYGWLVLLVYRFKGFKTVILNRTLEKISLSWPARLLGYKVIWLESEFLPKNFKFSPFRPGYKLKSGSATIISTSQAIWSERKSYNLNSKLINFSIDFKANSQESIFHDLAEQDYMIKNKSVFVIGYVGNLERGCGVEYLIKSIQYFNELIPDFQLVIVGDGPERKGLTWMSNMLGYERHVRFVGRQNNVERWYEHFNVVASPLTEPKPFDWHSAMALKYGLPVVGSDVDGIGEIVDNDCGILVEPKNSQLMAQAIFALYNDPDMRKKLGDNGRQKIQEKYSPEKFLSDWKEILS
jgi:glycosyltransferase involved in cell wall biosynthesis